MSRLQRGDGLVIDALESGEDHGLACYRKDLAELDPDVRALMTGELLPEQEQTHRMMSTLKRQQAVRA